MTKISHRITGATIFEADVPTVREAAELAVKQGVSLAGANLAGANLAGANLAGANLAGANLAGAYLADANLAGANLAGANLDDAYLADAYGVAGQTDPPEPYVRDTSRNYAARAERARKRHPEVPVVADLDKRILQAIENGSGQLDMSRWHTCETVHCMAGWAIVLAGDKGKELEAAHGSHRAGMLIFSCSTGQVPHFFAKNDVALADLKARVAEAQASEQTTP